MKEKLLVLDAEFVNNYLDMRQCIKIMSKTLKSIENKANMQYLRHVVELPNKNILGMMPGYSNEGYFGAKILSVYPQNSQYGYPSHQGQILLFEAEHGQLKAVVDATSITKIRTGAVSSVATKILANPDSTNLSLLGTGEQAESHLQAMMEQFDLKTVTIWDRNFEKAKEFVQKESLKYKGKIHACKTVKEAVLHADIICTLTASTVPILENKWLKLGVHINAVGACKSSDRELTSEIVKRALFFGDDKLAVMNESGDFLIPLEENIIKKDHFIGTIGQVMNNRILGRRKEGDITIFESLGIASEDLAVAEYLYKIAKNLENGVVN